MPADPDRLAAIAAARGGAFSAADAMSAGFTQRQISHRVARCEWRKLRRGIYCDAGRYDGSDAAGRLHIHLVAALLAAPSAVASHVSAGRHFDWPFLGSWDARPWLTADRGDTRRTPVNNRTWVIEAAGLPDDQWALVDGLRVTTRPRSAVDLARHLPVREGLVVVDAALHRGDVDPDGLAAVVAYCENWPGIRRARKVVDLADGRSESPYESVARLQCFRLGVDTDPQAWMYDGRGCIGRTDLRIVGHNAVLEVDGAVKYGDDEPGSLLGEKRRHERIEQAGIAVGRLSAAESMARDVVAERVAVTCARAAVMAAAGLDGGWFGPPPPWFRAGRAS